jgi:hypothetical protein
MAVQRLASQYGAVRADIDGVRARAVQRKHILDQRVLTKSDAESRDLTISEDYCTADDWWIAQTFGTVGLPMIANPLRSMDTLLARISIAVVLAGGIKFFLSI